MNSWGIMGLAVWSSLLLISCTPPIYDGWQTPTAPDESAELFVSVRVRENDASLDYAEWFRCFDFTAPDSSERRLTVKVPDRITTEFGTFFVNASPERLSTFAFRNTGPTALGCTAETSRSYVFEHARTEDGANHVQVTCEYEQLGSTRELEFTVSLYFAEPERDDAVAAHISSLSRLPPAPPAL